MVAAKTPSTLSSGGAIVAGGALASNSGSGGATFCPTSDNSFYCQMSRSLGILQMTITFIIIFIAIIYLIYYVISNRKALFGK